MIAGVDDGVRGGAADLLPEVSHLAAQRLLDDVPGCNALDLSFVTVRANAACGRPAIGLPIRSIVTPQLASGGGDAAGLFGM